jgi:2',3'-cyclic-nucleotide 2'-phosphodiesterase (5'-nucleotidase family)
MIQISGLAFSYASTESSFSRVREAAIEGEPLDDGKVYTVITTEMLAGGGHLYESFLKGSEREKLPLSLYQTVSHQIQSCSVKTPTDVRIREITQ